MITYSQKTAVLATIGAAILACLTTNTQAAEGRWTKGFGQGNLEYFIDSKGWQLLIGCPTQDGSADSTSSVSLVDLRSDRQVKSFVIRVGGKEYQGPIEADSRVGANSFIGLLEDLRRGDAVVTHAKGSVTFPKSNVASVVPVYGKRFPCNVG